MSVPNYDDDELEQYKVVDDDELEQYKVVDDDELAQYKDSAGNIVDYIAQSVPMQTVYGAGDIFAKIMSLGALPGTASEYFGVGKPETLSYNIGRISGAITAAYLQSLLGGAGVQAGVGAGMLPQALSKYSNLLGDVVAGGSTGYALSEPEDKMSSTVIGAAVGGGLSAIPYLKAGISKNLSKNIFKELTNLYSDTNVGMLEQTGASFYDKALTPFKKNKLITTPDLEEAIEETKKLAIPGGGILKSIKNISDKKATIKDAETFKRFLNNKIYKDLKARPILDSPGHEQLTAYTNLRKALINTINTSLRDESAVAAYANADRFWGKVVAPALKVSSTIKEEMPRVDFMSKATARKVAESLRRSAQIDPGSVPVQALDAANKIVDMQRRAKQIKLFLKIAGAIGSAKGLHSLYESAFGK